MAQGENIPIIGAGPGVCPVCELAPCALRDIAGVPLAECARCGAAFLIEDENGRPVEARFTSPPAWLLLLRIYWKETGKRLGPPDSFLERAPAHVAARTRAISRWIQGRPDLMVGAMAPGTYPMVSYTAVLSISDKGKTWTIIAPPSGMRAPVQVFVPVEAFPPGTIITVQVPVVPADVSVDDERPKLVN